MIIPAVSHTIVNMTAGYGTAFDGAQSKASARAISVFMVISAIDHAAMHVTTGSRTPVNRTDGDHGLLGRCTPPMTAALSMVAAMSIGGYGQ